MQVKLFPQPPAGRAGVASEELHLENNLFSTYTRGLLIAIPEDSALTTLLALDVPPRSPCEPGGSELLSVFPHLVGSWGPQASPARCPLGWLTAAHQAARGWSAVVKETWLDIYPLTSLWGPTWGDGVWSCRCPFSANRRKGTVRIHLCRSTVRVIRALRSSPLVWRVNSTAGKATSTKEGDKAMCYSKMANISQNQATASHVSFLTRWCTHAHHYLIFFQNN